LLPSLRSSLCFPSILKTHLPQLLLTILSILSIRWLRSLLSRLTILSPLSLQTTLCFLSIHSRR